MIIWIQIQLPPGSGSGNFFTRLKYIHTMFTSNNLIRYTRLFAFLLSMAAGLSVMPSALAQANAPANKKAEPVLIDTIIAVVNTDVITRSDLKKRMDQVESTLRSRKAAMPPRAELQKQVLERMIVDRAQLHMAKEAGIRVDDIFLDRAISGIAAQNKLTPQELRKKVEGDGIQFAHFREQIRDEIIMRRLREKEVDNKIQVSDSEIDNFIAASGMSQEQQEINLGHIMVRIPENASPEQIAARKTRAEEVLQQLKAGADFGKLAATYSDAEEALKGGEVGWRKQDRIPQIFMDAVTNLKTGEISAIVKSANGFHILKIVGKRSAGQASPSAASVQQTHARHILIKINQLVTADEARRKLQELKQRLDNKAAKFEDLAKLFSNDLSANKGGDLGWIYPGDTVPDFERAMNALKPGQISEPVESPFGFHLIEVLERKTDEVSQERLRMVARQAIRERKTEEATENWLRQVRDSAYVEYRVEEK
jgi:peptidyl-prolyl cis-trans isomerase SurA